MNMNLYLEHNSINFYVGLLKYKFGMEDTVEFISPETKLKWGWYKVDLLLAYHKIVPKELKNSARHRFAALRAD